MASTRRNPALPDALFTVHHGDARQLESLLAPYSTAAKPILTSTITSPPYGAMKDYRHPDQIGFGQSHEDYLVELRRIFRIIARHTKSDGSMWLVADTFRPYESNGALRRLEPLPFQLAAEAEDAGWILRDVIVWRKGKTLPWSGRGRLRNAFEYILFFVKTKDFKYYVDRVRDPIELEQWWTKWPERYNPQGKTPDNVWDIPIPVQGSWRNTAVQHTCPLPPDLVERLTLLSTDPGDIVFDPFAGSGVVVAEAERLGRRGIGIELVKKHVRAFNSVVRPEILTRDKEDILSRRLEQAEWLQDVILKLRIVKYPKVLIQMLRRAYPHTKGPIAAVVLGNPSIKRVPTEPHKVVDARTIFVAGGDADERDHLARRLKELSGQQPASKFGIAGDIRVVSPRELEEVVARKRLHLYLGGRTWMAVGRVTAPKLLAAAKESAAAKYPPIAANVEVKEKPRALEREESPTAARMANVKGIYEET